MNNLKIKALLARYEADILEGKATLEIYINNSVGIGEHPQHLEEMDTILSKMAEAADKIEILNGILASNQQAPQTLSEKTS